MIRIHRPDEPPAILADKGKKKQRALCSAYSKARRAYQAGKKRFAFDAGIYGHQSVKDALRAAQHDKCCFCESKISHIAYGDVEHFRPKAGWRQAPSEPLSTPGYYWLAYAWSNLLFSCQLCNQRYKANLFPLLDASKRARSHRHDTGREQPLFINPAEQDPERFISFRAEIPYAIGDNIEGRSTIEALGLHREALNQRRREHLSVLKCLWIVASLVPALPVRDEARELLRMATQNTAEYASMARAAMASGFSAFPESGAPL